MALIGLPVALVAAASAFLATTSITPAESVPVRLGSAQAWVADAGGPVSDQSLDAESWSNTAGPRSDGTEGSEPATAASIASSSGRPVSAVGYPSLLGSGAARPLSALAFDEGLLPQSSLAELVSGRWPRDTSEILTTLRGQEVGVGVGQRLTLRRADPSVERPESNGPATVTVVGVATARDPHYRPLDLVVGARWAGLGERGVATFLLLGDRPVGWTELRELNAAGLVVLSPTVLADPPPEAEAWAVPPGRDGIGTAIVAAVCVGLVLETTLLAGPAFAVSATRRRRTLALVAVNGGDSRQVRRFVLAQGLLLGGVSAVAGVVLGTLVGWAGAAVGSWLLPQLPVGPVGVYPLLTVAVALAALVAAVTAAMIPARGAARLVLAATVAGQGSRAGDRSRPWAFVLGSSVSVVGGLGLVATRWVSPSGFQVLLVVVAGGVLVVGTVGLLAPLLRCAGRLLGRAGPAVRMAARDSARQTGRAVPAVAAIMVAVAVLVVGAVGLTSSDAQQEQLYEPTAPFGHGLLSGNTTAAESAALATLRARHPDWRVATRGLLGETDGPRRTVLAAVPAGCRAADAWPSGSDETGGGRAECQLLGTDSGAGTLSAWSRSALDPDVTLEPEQDRVLAAGGALVSDEASQVVRNGRLALATGTVGTDGAVLVERRQSVPAVVVPDDLLRRLSYGQVTYSALFDLDRVTAGPIAPIAYDISDPAGPITVADAEALAAPSLSVEVERGWHRGDQLETKVGALVVVLLAAVAATIATALAQSEARSDLSTLAAIGAGPGFRRRFAAAQGLVTAGAGVVAGVLAAALPAAVLGVTLTGGRLLSGTTRRYADPVLAVPWSTLAVAAAAIVALASVSALLVAARPPELRRRAT